MAGFLPEHLPFSNMLGNASNIGSALRPTHRQSADRQASGQAGLVSMSKRQNTLIERRSLLFKLKSTHKYDDPGKAKHRICRARDRQFYRCDIHATSSKDERAAQRECKQLIAEAGGSVLDSFEYLGGFLFELAPGCTCPIETGDMTAEGGNITVEPWQPFSNRRRRFEALGQHANSSQRSVGTNLQKTVDGLFSCGRKQSMSLIGGDDDNSSSNRSSLFLDQENLTLMNVPVREPQSCLDRSDRESDLDDDDDAAEWVTLSDISDYEP